MSTNFIDVKRSLAVSAVLFSLFMSAGCRPKEESAPPPPPVRTQPGVVIGLLPEQNVFQQKELYRPLGEYLSGKLSRPVSFKLLDSYAVILQEIKEKKIDGAFFGSLNFVLTNIQSGVEILARPVWKNGISTYRGYIFARKDSGLTADVRGWKGKVLAFVSTATTAGYVFPLAYLKARQVEHPETYFSRVFFTGSHDAAALAVLNREADIGSCKDTIYDTLAEKNPAIKNELVILARSAEVPSNGLAMRPDVDPEIKSALKNALMNMHNDPNGRQVLDGFGARNFIETTLADYQPVYVMAKEAGLDLKNYPLSPKYTQFVSPHPQGQNK